MSVEKHEQLRTNIFDRIYHNGPQSIDQLAEYMQMNMQTVIGLVDHAWFSVDNELVGIATDDKQGQTR